MKCLTVLLLLCSFIIAAEKMYGNVYVSKLLSVHDGDTFEIDVNSWPEICGKGISVRIYGIDTPEMTSKDSVVKAKAVAAKVFVTNMLTNAKKIKLVNLRRDKYFRIDAEVYADGKNVADTLVKLGLAKVYDGGTKEPW